jgi:hypothetical protein
LKPAALLSTGRSRKMYLGGGKSLKTNVRNKEIRKLEKNKRNDREAFKAALTTYYKMVRHSKGNPLSSSVRR